MSKEKLFASEADLVAKFCWLIDPARWARNPVHAPKWTPYHETAGWDLLLVHETGVQIGIEAKLSLNAKVLDQALPGRWAETSGPDFRAILVPSDGLQHHLHSLARHVGISVIILHGQAGYAEGSPYRYEFNPHLPDLKTLYELLDWPNWCPAERCNLPDYVPDVIGGRSAPVSLTVWKVRAIKLLILLERRGFVTRRDMKALQISPTRWTDAYHGFLAPGPGGYVRSDLTPDLRAQHPKNWAEIEADFGTWSKGIETAGQLGLETA